MVTFIIGDVLTGRRIQTLPALSGSWSESINDVGEITATVSLRNSVVKKLGLAESAQTGKAFLAAIEGDTVLQAGPIWDHDYDGDRRRLTLRANGLLSYFDHRVVLPVLAGRLPSDPNTDTLYMPQQLDADAPFPNATDTTRSLQGIMVGLFTQAMSWTNGNVPLTLPSVIAGTNERAYRGSDLASVWERARGITQVLNGPEVRVTGQYTSDRLGIQWVAEIGTPTQPLIFSPQRQVFYVGNDKSSVTKLRVQISGNQMGSQAYASGGRSVGQSIVSASSDSTLTSAGFPLLDLVDSSHSTAQDLTTLQGYSDELVLRGRKPTSVWSLTHNVSTQPFLSSFRAGDFADVRVISDPYLAIKTHGMRIIGRSGDERSKTVNLQFAPEV